MPPGRHAPTLLLLLGVAAISTGSIFLRLAEAPSAGEAFWRCALATLCLLPFASRTLLADWRALSPGGKRAGLLAGLLLAGHFAAWIESLAWTSVAQSVLLVSTTPLWVALLAPVVTGDRLTRLARWGLLAALLGTAAMHLEAPRGARDPLWGGFLALVGAWCASGYLLIGRRLRRELPLFSYSVICYGSAALTLLALNLSTGSPLTGYSGATWGWLALAALIPQGVGHTTLNWALRHAGAPLVSVSLLGEPAAATLLAWVFLGERPTEVLILGGPIVLFGIWLSSRGESQRPSA
ncbi:MAG: DMT family transporter [Planctomycetes bacterium]|nr:DMT family transporter [Planctomycetota bacterium]